jgi:hypothetical protein
MNDRQYYLLRFCISLLIFTLVFCEFGTAMSFLRDSMLIIRPSFWRVAGWSAFLGWFFSLSVWYFVAAFSEKHAREYALTLKKEDVDLMTGAGTFQLRTGSYVLAIAFFLVFLSNFYGYFYPGLHFKPLMTRNAEKIVVSSYDWPSDKLDKVIDRRCLKFVSLYDFDLPPQPKLADIKKDGVYCSLSHAEGCCCSGSTKKVFVSDKYFPFDAAVLLYALAAGEVDLSKAGQFPRSWVSVSS